MADFDVAGQEDDVTLPRAAVNKLIKEMIPNIRVSNDARELILNCCTEANEICKQKAKKTISPEHIIEALKSLGFPTYVNEVQSVFNDYKKQATNRRRGSNRLENLGIPEEELLRQQQELFAQARLQQAQAEQQEQQNLQIQTLQSAQSNTSHSDNNPPGYTPAM